MAWPYLVGFITHALISHAADGSAPGECRAEAPDAECRAKSQSLEEEARARSCSDGCEVLRPGEWLNPGERLVVEGDRSNGLFARLTDEGDLLVLDTSHSSQATAVIWQASSYSQLLSDEAASVKPRYDAIADAGAKPRLVLQPDGLRITRGEHILWEAALTGPAGELRLLKTGELVLSGSASERLDLSKSTTIHSALDDLCLDYHPVEKTVYVKGCHGEANQLWKLSAKSLMTERDFACLESPQIRPRQLKEAGGGGARMVKCRNFASQRWFLDQWNRLQSESGMCLETSRGTGDRPVLTAGCRPHVRQYWKSGPREPVWRSGVTREDLLPSESAEAHVDESQKGMCNTHFSCKPCVDAGCGWCLSRRKCVPDEPYHCDSGEDHVSSKAVYKGQPDTCPRTEDLEAEKLRRREARSAAAHDTVNVEEENMEDAEEAFDHSEPKKKHLKELQKRARWADEGAGSSKPYEVLGVSHKAPPSKIRQAYRKLSLKFHPDKNPEHSDLARRAFADLSEAYDLIGSPDKRAAFDEYGSKEFEEAWKSGRWRGDEDLFFGSPLITTLTVKLWEKRLVGKSIWIIDLYASWCPHCRNFLNTFKQIAQILDETDSGVDAGAVNCVKQLAICKDYVGVKSYPTIVLLNREAGMLQWYHGTAHPKHAQQIAEWAREIAKEWRFLLTYSRVHSANAANFQDVLNTTDMVLVLFSDGLDCSPCRTAKTNLMRLSASLLGLPVRTVIVDCEDPQNNRLCYEEHGIPASPHRPVLQAWPRRAAGSATNETRGPGEMLYNVNDLEAHIALELLERTIRLSLGPEMQSDPAALSAGMRGKYDGDEEDDDIEPAGFDSANFQKQRDAAGSVTAPSRPAIQFEGPDHQSKPSPWKPWAGPTFQQQQISH